MAQPSTEASARITYREVVRQPVWLLVVVWGLSALLAFTFIASARLLGGILLLVALGGICTFLILRSALRITVSPEQVTVGTLRILMTSITAATPLDAQETSRTIGPDSDARARLCLRNLSTKKSVRIDLDPDRPGASPIPFVVVSSHHPRRFSAAITAALPVSQKPPQRPADR